MDKKKSLREEMDNHGIAFIGTLTIIFIALKLLNKIDWSWFWILSPLWLPIIISFSVIALMFLSFFAYHLMGFTVSIISYLTKEIIKKSKGKSL